jgi:tRNA(Phe) wybutosine-synthesizing methylase Tyw3
MNEPFFTSIGDKDIIRIRVDRTVSAPIGSTANICIDPNYVRFFNKRTELAVHREAQS